MDESPPNTPASQSVVESPLPESPPDLRLSFGESSIHNPPSDAGKYNYFNS